MAFDPDYLFKKSKQNNKQKNFGKSKQCKLNHPKNKHTISPTIKYTGRLHVPPVMNEREMISHQSMLLPAT